MLINQGMKKLTDISKKLNQQVEVVVFATHIERRIKGQIEKIIEKDKEEGNKTKKNIKKREKTMKKTLIFYVNYSVYRCSFFYWFPLFKIFIIFTFYNTFIFIIS